MCKKFEYLLLAVIILMIGTVGAQKRTSDFPILTGPYLGQKPPGMTPEIFAPGIISTLAHEYSFTVSPDGSEIFFTRHIGEYSHIYYTKIENGRWTEPRIAPFSGKFADYDQCFAPDGNSIYFVSDRPRPGTPFIGDIWFVTRTKNGWSAPQNIGSPVNTEQNEACPSLTKDGTLYFHAVYPDGIGSSDIYASKYLDGMFADPENLGSAVNSRHGDSNAFIAQDESYIIFGSRRPGGFGNGDLYISFRDKHGEWTEAVSMGDRVNSEYSEYCPSVSPDGKFLFFTRIDSSRERRGDIYWMDAGIIEELRSKINGKTNSASPSESVI
ncbi:MAG: PD40 domain-containing protein [Candidatus Aminicenantes bacterium]|nr:MAG: PD40 domain-containing protein [Candidatus Aminicenantes bacterium]